MIAGLTNEIVIKDHHRHCSDFVNFVSV